MMNFLLYTAVTLCVAAAVALVVSLIFFKLKKPKIELLTGMLALISTVVSFLVYYYLRIILSGGGFSDNRVVFVVLVYVVSSILSLLSVIDGRKKLKYDRL